MGGERGRGVKRGGMGKKLGKVGMWENLNLASIRANHHPVVREHDWYSCIQGEKWNSGDEILLLCANCHPGWSGNTIGWEIELWWDYLFYYVPIMIQTGGIMILGKRCFLNAYIVCIVYKLCLLYILLYMRRSCYHDPLVCVGHLAPSVNELSMMNSFLRWDCNMWSCSFTSESLISCWDIAIDHVCLIFQTEENQIIRFHIKLVL